MITYRQKLCHRNEALRYGGVIHTSSWKWEKACCVRMCHNLHPYYGGFITVCWNNIVRVIFFPDSLPYKGSIPVFSNVRKRKEKRIKKRRYFLFEGLMYGLIPIHGGINHSPRLNSHTEKNVRRMRRRTGNKCLITFQEHNLCHTLYDSMSSSLVTKTISPWLKEVTTISYFRNHPTPLHPPP